MRVRVSAPQHGHAATAAWALARSLVALLVGHKPNLRGLRGGQVGHRPLRYTYLYISAYSAGDRGTV